MNGGSSGEMEETIMRNTVSHEEEDWTRYVASANDNGPLVDKWRKNWLDRMERHRLLSICRSYHYPAPLRIHHLQHFRNRQRKQAVCSSAARCPQSHLEA
ncbi:hypothetical protein K443DRAFT_340602 [Laccaria amethystina LaAM-08-1]|uniref:Unplaced genomic scaffold K443scaffold_236, whole genome shotgun sequence n=1 Tax=Laccaria amethystina LaAM-08-1 TaxID=1095629 RepID=A0A0C9WJN6_9AGAR|nr:hypothetical protein K443DRAFT_340602 [Laccaria amethystina LaAM-08-1]